MSVTIRLEGSEQLQRELRRLSDDLRREVGQVVSGAALEMRNDIVSSLDRGPASGVTYKKSNPTRTHTASAPGQPPMTDTGRLANSITFDRLGDLTAVVGTKVDYAPHLEYGTSRMAARPFFRPAVERMRPKYIGKLEDIIRRAAR